MTVLAMTVAVTYIATTINNQPSYAGNNKFFCTVEGGVHVTKVRTSRGDETFIRWTVKDFKKFPPSQRCRIVSNRFQRYYDNGEIFITSRDNLNGYPVLCIANSKGTPCASENILVTLKPGSDTGATLKQMLYFRRGTANSPLNLSGGQYITYDNGDLYLDVKALVDSSQDSSQPSSTNNTPPTEPEPRF